MQVVKHRPFTNSSRFMDPDYDAFFNNNLDIIGSLSPVNAMDVYKEGGILFADLYLPTFSKEEITVTIDKDILKVSAKHKDSAEKKLKKTYIFKETSDHYYRSLRLPEGVNSNKSKAQYINGILKISMPINNEIKTSKEITIT